jgi:hypothetical protein
MEAMNIANPHDRAPRIAGFTLLISTAVSLGTSTKRIAIHKTAIAIDIGNGK